MTTTQPKFKPAHAVLIVAMAMAALAVAIFLFKERLLPDQNAPYREQMSGWVETRAVVTANETLRGLRNRSRVRLTVEFRDGAGELRSASVYDNALGGAPKATRSPCGTTPQPRSRPRVTGSTRRLWGLSGDNGNKTNIKR